MDKTHFGFKTVEPHEKTSKVEAVFSSVASRYDLMNDLMSFGAHRVWKAAFIRTICVKPEQIILDLAGGTGDIAVKLCQKLEGTGQVILSDINFDMLKKGKQKIINKQFFNNLDYLQTDATQLPFASNTFDRITMSFGLRNVTDQSTALSEMYRVLKPGGRCLILEFSKPENACLSKLYDLYSFNVIPRIGQYVAQDAASYQYLVESIRMHPDQETLKGIMESSGFDEVNYQNLSLGIVAIHQGIKF